MRDPIHTFRLMPCARGNPHAERGAFHSRHPIAGHGEAIGKPRDLNTHRPFPSNVSLMNLLTAPRSFVSRAWRSSRSKRSDKADGSAGRLPTARSMASGNLAGSAV